MQNEPFFLIAGRDLYSLLQRISIVSAVLRLAKGKAIDLQSRYGCKQNQLNSRAEPKAN